MTLTFSLYCGHTLSRDIAPTVSITCSPFYHELRVPVMHTCNYYTGDVYIPLTNMGRVNWGGQPGEREVGLGRARRQRHGT